MLEDPAPFTAAQEARIRALIAEAQNQRDDAQTRRCQALALIFDYIMASTPASQPRPGDTPPSLSSLVLEMYTMVPALVDAITAKEGRIPELFSFAHPPSPENQQRGSES